MARPVKNTVEYFPHYVNLSDVLNIMMDNFGNDGYIFFYRLYELLGRSEGHYLDCQKTLMWRQVLKYININEEDVANMMDMLVELEIADKELWESRIIWIESFVKDLSIVYHRRKSELPSKPELGNSKLVENAQKCAITPIVEYSKESIKSIDNEVENEFNNFITQYPPAKVDDKECALDAFKILTVEDRAAVIERMEYQNNFWNIPDFDKKYIPYAAKYLTEKRFYNKEIDKAIKDKNYMERQKKEYNKYMSESEENAASQEEINEILLEATGRKRSSP